MLWHSNKHTVLGLEWHSDLVLCGRQQRPRELTLTRASLPPDQCVCQARPAGGGRSIAIVALSQARECRGAVAGAELSQELAEECAPSNEPAKMDFATSTLAPDTGDRLRIAAVVDDVQGRLIVVGLATEAHGQGILVAVGVALRCPIHEGVAPPPGRSPQVAGRIPA